MNGKSKQHGYIAYPDKSKPSNHVNINHVDMYGLQDMVILHNYNQIYGSQAVAKDCSEF